jgi:hypothetical protein
MIVLQIIVALAIFLLSYFDFKKVHKKNKTFKELQGYYNAFFGFFISVSIFIISILKILGFKIN